MIGSKEFPRLTADNHRITSPAMPAYNCIAWAANDTKHWWQPGRYWKPEHWPEDDFGLGALEHAFFAMHYANCELDAGLEPGFEKVALYGSGSEYSHAARQLPSGKWTSKLGKSEDIEHDTPNDVAGGIYGDVMEIMKRPAQKIQIEFVVAPDHLLKQADEILRANIRCTKGHRRDIRAVAKAYIDEADELKWSLHEIKTDASIVQLATESPPHMIEKARALEAGVLANKALQKKVRAVAKSYVEVAEENNRLYTEFKEKYRDILPPEKSK